MMRDPMTAERLFIALLWRGHKRRKRFRHVAEAEGAAPELLAPLAGRALSITRERAGDVLVDDTAP
jgi:hypothetical protein